MPLSKTGDNLRTMHHIIKVNKLNKITTMHMRPTRIMRQVLLI